MSAMKMLVPVKVLLWSTVSIGLGLAIANISSSNSALASPVLIPQEGDAVKVVPFTVTVTLTEKARLRLEKPKETIIVSVSLYGEPKKNASVKVNEVGLVDIANNRQIELSKAGRAQFNRLSISALKLNQLVSQDYTVNVNVFSGRRSSQDNLLSCDFFEGKISSLQRGVTLKCGLIGEYNGQYKKSLKVFK